MATRGASDVARFLRALPPERRTVLERVRQVVLTHLPDGYGERLSGNFITYEVPLDRYPSTYNRQPLMYAALARQKNYYALYLMSAYQDPEVDKQLRAGFKNAGKKLDMGKSCIRFRTLEDLPLAVVGQAIGATPVVAFIEQHERRRHARPKAAAKR